MEKSNHDKDLNVLALISGGLIVILLSIIAGLFLAKSSAALPNWAENVLITIATAAGLKLGDSLSALIALASGRQVTSLSEQLGHSQPSAPPPPKSALEGAEQATRAAQERTDEIAQSMHVDDPEK